MTIKEIAAQAGVGVSTVSRYLNDGYVSEEKREIIKQVIEENNYRPSGAALSMRGKSNEVVIIVQRVSSNTTARFLEGVIKQCTSLNISPTIYSVNFDIKLQTEYIQKAVDRNVLGIIIYSFTEEVEADFDNLLVVGQQSSQYKSIYSDGKKIYTQLTETIVNNNQISEMVVMGIEIMDIEMINRVAGAVEVAKRENIKYRVEHQSFDKLDNQMKLEKGTYYVCLTDAQAYQIISFANQQNLKVGEDIYISGYGDYSTSDLLELTTVDGMYELVGQQAIISINDKLTDSVQIEPEIKYRKSGK